MGCGCRATNISGVGCMDMYRAAKQFGPLKAGVSRGGMSDVQTLRHSFVSCAKTVPYHVPLTGVAPVKQPEALSTRFQEAAKPPILGTCEIRGGLTVGGGNIRHSDQAGTGLIVCGGGLFSMDGWRWRPASGLGIIHSPFGPPGMKPHESSTLREFTVLGTVQHDTHHQPGTGVCRIMHISSPRLRDLDLLGPRQSMNRSPLEP